MFWNFENITKKVFWNTTIQLKRYSVNPNVSVHTGIVEYNTTPFYFMYYPNYDYAEFVVHNENVIKKYQENKKNVATRNEFYNSFQNIFLKNMDGFLGSFILPVLCSYKLNEVEIKEGLDTLVSIYQTDNILFQLNNTKQKNINRTS
jgi:hypothetical protein